MTASVNNKEMNSSVLALGSSTFFNALYLFKIILYVLGFIGFSWPLNVLCFILLCLKINIKYVGQAYRYLVGTAALVLFYHDSYLPGLKQLMAQRANLKDFSFGYILEFLTDFLNFKTYPRP